MVTVASPLAAKPLTHHLHLADTQLVDDPRGGWRFLDPGDELHFGVAGDAGRRATPAVIVTSQETPEEREQRLAFGGDAQRPPQAHPHTGTQGTWDDALLGPNPPLHPASGR